MSAFMRGAGKGEGWRVYDEVQECAGCVGRGRVAVIEKALDRADVARPVESHLLGRASPSVSADVTLHHPLSVASEGSAVLSLPYPHARVSTGGDSGPNDSRQVAERTNVNEQPVDTQTAGTATPGSSDLIFFACLRHIKRAFPGENDPDRHEALAFLYQRVAYRHQQHAERLRDMAAADGGR